MDTISPRAVVSRESTDYPYAPAAPVVVTELPLEVGDAATPQAWLAVMLVLAFLVADFSISPLMYAAGGSPKDFGFFLIPIGFGIIAAQAAVLSAWLVWGEGPFLWRLLYHWGIVAVCCWVWIAGLATRARGTDLIDGHCVLALSMAIVSAAIQAPLWLTRQILAWRLVRPGTAAAAVPERPSSIGNLMLATSVAAVALAFARIVPTDLSASDVGTMWFVVVAFSAGIAGLGILPLALCLLRLRSVGLGLALSLIYLFVVIALMWAGVVLWVVVFVTAWTTLPFEGLAIMSGVVVSFALMFALCALVARGFGFRLVLGRDSRQPASPVHLV